MLNFIETEETFVAVWTYGHLRPSLLGRLRRVNVPEDPTVMDDITSHCKSNNYVYLINVINTAFS